MPILKPLELSLSRPPSGTSMSHSEQSLATMPRFQATFSDFASSFGVLPPQSKLPLALHSPRLRHAAQSDITAASGSSPMNPTVKTAELGFASPGGPRTPMGVLKPPLFAEGTGSEKPKNFTPSTSRLAHLHDESPTPDTKKVVRSPMTSHLRDRSYFRISRGKEKVIDSESILIRSWPRTHCWHKIWKKKVLPGSLIPGEPRC